MLTPLYFARQLVLYIGTLNKQLAICRVNSQGTVIGGQPGCYNLIPVFDWIRRCIISIFLVFIISFLPLFLTGLLPIVSPFRTSLTQFVS